MRALRASLSQAEIERSSERIEENVMMLSEWQSAHTIHVFIGSLPGEVRTDRLIRHCLERNCRVMVPIVDQSTNGMRSVWLRSLDELVPTSWGGREPTTTEAADESAIDVVIVPGVAFDRTGHRLGMGGGYYDRFLSHIHAPRIAVAHATQVIDHVPVETPDESVDIIVTPDETIVCPRSTRFSH